MKKLVVANWKMLPASLAEAREILERIDGCLRDGVDADLVVCPPFVFVEEVAQMLAEGALAEGASLGAQDIADRDEGALTGEVSGPQLVKLGVRFVLIGHSERRWKLGESDDVVNAKLRAALRAGLVPIVCLGERTRDGAWQEELAAQTAATFRGLTAGQVGQCLIAYEPVWAISTNPDAKPDTPAGAVQSMSHIRQTLADHFDVSHTTFLYGGSVTPANAKEFLERPEISGVLVGGASVHPEEFCRILMVATR
ncbi:MAG: triose-phosphate isomerase [Candidatus Yanofskybacteria bacterium]|nr:triose-phosphate isomerase [Candidatus Yanofskybacteria bacterium]